MSIYLSKNLRYLREQNNKQSQSSLAEKIGVTRSAISSYEDGRAEPKLEVLVKFSEYFNVSIDQLLNAELVKLDASKLARKQDIDKYVSAQNMRVLTITVDNQENEYIELIPQKAAAGYMTGYADDTFLSELPKYQLPFLPTGKTYRAFEISGESMLPILPNSIIVGEYVVDWNELKNGQTCIVVSKHDGIVLKNVYNYVKENGTFLLKSNNILYQSYEIEAEEVIEIWRFAAYISKQPPQENITTVQDLKEAFLRLEDDVREIRTNIKPKDIND